MGPLRYQSTTGLDTGQIEELVARIWQVLASRPKRWGRPPLVGLYRSVVVTLMMIRSNLNQTTVADVIGVSQSTVSRIFRKFMPLIEQVTCVHAPAFPGVLAGRVVLVDGTLIPTGNRAGHRENYSGKRHRAGLNIQVLADMSGVLLAVSAPRHGAVHDRTALAEVGWEGVLLDHSTIGDLGYQGTNVITPRRKAQGGEHSIRDKEANRTISGIRSSIERAIAHLKNWKILATGYRGRLAELPNIIRIVTALEFYRIGW